MVNVFLKIFCAFSLALTLILSNSFISQNESQAAGLFSGDVPNFVNLAAKSGSAVVNINSEKSSKSQSMEDFFGDMFRNLPPGTEKFFEHFGPRRRPPHKQKSLGSGFIISADGYIVTNNHVVADADTIRVTLHSSKGKGKTVTATLVGTDEETDLALLKISVDESLPFLKFGDSEKLKVGEWLLAIGNPFGLDHSVTAGILSAKGRNIHSGPFDDFLQTDASINPGNSGGPLINLEGDVIGINTAIIAAGQGIGFAIPSNMAADIIEQLRTGKKMSRGWLGVSIQDVEETAAKALGLEKARGALISEVMANEPAAKAGLEAGDIILTVDNQDIEDASELLKVIASKKPNSQVKLGIWRNGKIETKTVTLGERAIGQANNERQDNKKNGISKAEELLGLTLRPLKSNERRNFKIEKEEGLLVVDVDGDKVAAEADIRTNDIILRANRISLKNVGDLEQVIEQEGRKRGAIMLQIMRRNDVLFKPLTIPKN